MLKSKEVLFPGCQRELLPTSLSRSRPLCSFLLSATTNTLEVDSGYRGDLFSRLHAYVRRAEVDHDIDEEEEVDYAVEKLYIERLSILE